MGSVTSSVVPSPRGARQFDRPSQRVDAVSKADESVAAATFRESGRNQTVREPGDPVRAAAPGVRQAGHPAGPLKPRRDSSRKLAVAVRAASRLGRRRKEQIVADPTQTDPDKYKIAAATVGVQGATTALPSVRKGGQNQTLCKPSRFAR